MSKLNQALRLTAGILLALPAMVSAAPIYVEYDVSIADYCNCEGSGYHPGERVVGWLRIDTERAPPDRFANEPSNQVAAQYWTPNGPDFISGTGGPGIPLLGLDASDEVSVHDDSGRFGFQGYAIWDYSKNRGRPGATILELQIFSEDRVDDFIHGKGLVQSFDTADLKGDISFRGRITEQLKGVRRAFDLVLNRLSVTPGQCRAPT
jgi:hypothetical protein